MTFSVYVSSVSYTVQVTFYKVPEQHGNIYQLGLYMQKEIYGTKSKYKIQLFVISISICTSIPFILVYEGGDTGIV